MATETIPSTTAGGTSAAYVTVAAGASIQVFTIPTLGFRETVDVIRTHDESADVTLGRALSEGEPSAIITGPGKFKFVLSATDTATTVYYDA